MPVNMDKLVSLDRAKEIKTTENGMIATVEASSTASKAYAVGEYFYYTGKLYKATAPIASGGTITVGTNCTLAKLADDVGDLKSAIDDLSSDVLSAYEAYPNKFDKNTVTQGKRINVTKIIQDDPTTYVSDFIPVSPGDIVTFNQNLGSSSYGHAYYGSDKTEMLITFRSYQGNMVAVVPDGQGIAYMRCTGVLSAIDDFVVHVISPSTLHLQDTHENVEAVQKAFDDIAPVNVFDATTIWSNQIINSAGNYAARNGFFVTNYIMVTPGDHVQIPNLSSSTYCTNFYDNTLDRKATHPINSEWSEFVVPDGIYFIKTTGETENINSFYVYVTKQLETDMRELIDSATEAKENATTVKDALEFGFNPNPVNVFDPSTITSGKYIYKTGIYANNSAMFYTDFISVNPGDVVRRPDYKSSTYCTNLYYSDKSIAYTYPCNTDYSEFVIPDEVAFIQTTGELATINDFYVYVLTDLEANFENLVNETKTAINANPYLVQTIKSESELINGFNHCAFPSMCYFAGVEVMAYRCSKSHRTPVDPANWGGVMIDKRTANGERTHVMFLNGENFTGLSGEIRDAMIQPTRDGQYMILATWTTYTVEEVDHHDNLLVCFNQNLEIVDYLIESDVDYLYWGNSLITPEGYLICAAYGIDNNGVIIKRSSTTFSNGVSTLTMEEVATVAGEGTLASECCLGYFHDKLAVIIRRDSNNTIIKMTDNLEGTDGWGNDLYTRLNIHAPKLLPYSDGKYLPFYGALYVDGQHRNPIIGFYDVGNARVEAYGNYSPDIGANYGAYAGIVPRGGDEYDAVYYRESTEARDSLTAQTALYYRRINVREVIPALSYLM